MRNALPMALLLLAGCGGGGGSALPFVEGNRGSVAVTFSNGSGYGGTTTALTTLTSINGSAVGRTVTISLENGDRALRVIVVAASGATGSSVSLSQSAGSTVVYSDASGTWTATSGTITVTTRSASQAELALKNVVVTNSTGNTVTLNGTVAFTGS